MKKLLSLVVAIAMAVSYLPLAEAGESASMTLNVTLAQPLTLRTDPAGPFTVIAGKDLYFEVIAEDKDASKISIWHRGIPMDGVYFDIVEQTQTRCRAIFKWTPTPEQIQDYPYVVIFTANSVNSQGVETEVELEVQISVKPDPDLVSLTKIKREIDGIDIKAKQQYDYAIASNNPDVIQLIIAELQQMEQQVGDLLSELGTILDRRPDLAVQIKAVIEMGEAVTVKIRGYIRDLNNILHPIKIWSVPAGNVSQDEVGLFEVVEGDELKFQVIAEQEANPNLHLEAAELPQPDTFISYEIDPDNPCRREGQFRWIPDYGQAQDIPYIAKFRAFNDDGKEAILVIQIRVIKANMSITIPNSEWKILDAELNQWYENIGAFGQRLNAVINDGNKVVLVQVTNGPRIAYGVQPGDAPGPNVYCTKLAGISIPANDWIDVGALLVREEKELALIHGTPTEITSEGQSAEYGLTLDFRAVLLPRPEPDPGPLN